MGQGLLAVRPPFHAVGCKDAKLMGCICPSRYENPSQDHAQERLSAYKLSASNAFELSSMRSPEVLDDELLVEAELDFAVCEADRGRYVHQQKGKYHI